VTAALAGEERDVALAEVEAVRSSAQGEYRELLAATAEAVAAGENLSERQAQELDRIVSLGLQTGRIRAVYGPSGEQAALRTHRRLPGGVELAASTKAVNEALASLAGRSLDQIAVAAVGPGAFTVSLVAGGAELSVRLDRQGARLASVGV
jgi:hypothetical protein